MTEKLSQVGNVQERVESLEKEKEQMGKLLLESTQNNKKLKEVMNEKDLIIKKMQTELEKFLTIKEELAPIFKESGEMKKLIVTKDAEIAELKDNLEQATKIVGELPNIESYVKQAASAIKEMGEENIKIKTQVPFCDPA